MGKKRTEHRAVINLNEERVFRIFYNYINELDDKVKALEPIASSDKELCIFKRGVKGGISFFPRHTSKPALSKREGASRKPLRN